MESFDMWHPIDRIDKVRTKPLQIENDGQMSSGRSQTDASMENSESQARRVLPNSLIASCAAHGRRKLNFGSGDWQAAQSVALDLNLNRSLGELSDDELVALRDRYVALTTAAPALLEHLEREEGTSDLFADNDDDQRD